MGAILDLLKEVPLTAIVRERLTAAEQEIVTLKRENSILKEENSVLKSKVQNLEILRNQPKAQKPADPCPYCRQLTGELQRIERNPIFEDCGISNGHYKCSACGKTYKKDIQALPG